MNKDFRNLGSHYNKYIYPKPIENIEEEVIKVFGKGKKGTI